VAPLQATFEVKSPQEVAGSCRELIAELGLPTSLSEAGLSAADLPTYLESVPPEWREVVRAAY
jgi:alcohol dehydrogenase class IV